jgi:signal transduction histidine kinase
MVLGAGLLIVASLVMVSVLRKQLTDNLDEGLTQRAATIASALADTPANRLAGDEDLLVQVITAAGQVTDASHNLSGLGPIAPLQPGSRTLNNVPGRTETFRVLTRHFETGGDTLLVVGINYDDVTDPLSIVSRLFAFIIPGVVLLLGAITWWLTGRTLRPVELIRAEMAAIGGSNLGRRVPEPGTGDEIDRLARTMNQTLDRLEDSARRQHRFVADASHELRSPLTRIRSELEVDLARPDQADPIATERSVLAETIGVQRLVDDLLQLARSEAELTDVAPAPVDLDDIVLHEVRRLADRDGVRVDTRGVSAAQVSGDRAQLGRAVKNLLDNAERHAATVVTVTLDELDDVARLTVANDGAVIPPDKREHIFERFARLDDARTRDNGGSGLGLAITRDIVERHGGTIQVAADQPTRFVIELPLRR